MVGCMNHFIGDDERKRSKAPKELVDEEHPLLFKPFDHNEFLAFGYTEEGMKCEFALNAYCGV
ncbi:hypothetical protein KY285_027727 [Solanum tuberosum]|nr:hypothetical protein KY285_027727 [Solanum tuberosum]